MPGLFDELAAVPKPENNMLDVVAGCVDADEVEGTEPLRSRLDMMRDR